jgi:hypothetical protein
MTTILECITGSNLYGTNTPDSDKDYQGIFIADLDNYFGLEKIEELDLSVKDKDKFGKNNPEAIDKKLFEIRNFFKLGFQNNPNVIELFFINKENIVSKNEFYDIITENRDSFLNSENIKKRFIGYSFSQKKKMVVKLEHYNLFKDTYDLLSTFDDKQFLYEVNLFVNNISFECNNKGNYLIGDIYIPKNLSVKKAKQLIGERLKRVGHRQELILKYGYDCKFASHSVRLLLEAIELLTTKEIVFPLKYANDILEIKQGKYNIRQILKRIEDLETEIRSLEFKPYKNNYSKVNDLLINILKEEFTL